MLLVLNHSEDYGVDKAYHIDYDEGDYSVRFFWLDGFSLGLLIVHPDQEDGPESEKSEEEVPDKNGTHERPD